jgi:hypothetical protein
MRTLLLIAIVVTHAGIVAAQERTIDMIQREIVDAGEWRELICVPRARMDCGGATCEAGTPKIHLRIKRDGVKGGTVSRCDQTCETHQVAIQTSGIFTNIQPLYPRGYIVKVRGAQEFVEVVTAGLGTFVSSGDCTRMQ